MTPTAQKGPYLCRTVFHQSISQPISNQAHVWQSSSATTEPRSERELDPFLVVEEPSMMHAIHGEPPYGPIQPNTLSHLRPDVPGLHLIAVLGHDPPNENDRSRPRPLPLRYSPGLRYEVEGSEHRFVKG